MPAARENAAWKVLLVAQALLCLALPTIRVSWADDRWRQQDADELRTKMVPLLRAAEKGQLEAVKKAIEAEPKLASFRYPWPNTSYALVIAGLGEASSRVMQDGGAALHVATACGQKVIADYLLSKGADVNTADGLGRTALHYVAAPPSPPMDDGIWDGKTAKAFRDSAYASQKGLLERRMQVASVLLEKGAEIDRSDKFGWTALFVAAESNNRLIAEFLLKHGAKMDVYSAAHLGLKDQVTELLNREQTLQNKPGPGGMTVLSTAASHANREMVRMLIQRGVAVDDTGERNSPLAWAVKSRSVPVAELLLEAGADPDKAKLWGSPAVSWAARHGDMEMVKLLVEHGVRLDLSSPNINVPLCAAIIGGHEDIVQYLLVKGAKINVGRKVGATTPLQAAVERNQPQIAQYLIQHGATVDVFSAAGLGMVGRLRELLQDEPGLARQTDREKDSPYENCVGTALHWAAKFDQVEAARTLLDSGADVNALAGFCGPSPLHVAASNGRVEMTKFLLERGARVDARQKYLKLTPLAVAVKHRDNEDVILILLEHGADPEATIVDLSGKTCRITDGPRRFGTITPDGEDITYDVSEQYELIKRYKKQHSTKRPQESTEENGQ